MGIVGQVPLMIVLCVGILLNRLAFKDTNRSVQDNVCFVCLIER